METQTIITPTNANVSTVVDDLRGRRANWEQGALASSNTELYKLLAAAYAVYEACRLDPDLTSGIETLLDQLGLNYTKGTSLGLKVVRAVFATKETQEKHKYRHLAYARVLEVASYECVEPGKLSEFIEGKGGIDEIRRGDNKQKNSAFKAQLTKVAKSQLSNAPEAGVIATFKLSDRIKPADGERFCLALVRANGDGNGSIVYGISDQALVERALEFAGAEIRTSVTKKAEDDLFMGNIQQDKKNAAAATAVLSSKLKISKDVTSA